jgi:NitT/TauT family transport system ATP-binding protein
MQHSENYEAREKDLPGHAQYRGRVLLADRIVVLGTHPAKIRADFRISLPHPRDRKSVEFLVYVDYIYKVMTQPELEFSPFTKLPSIRKPSFQVLPHASAGGMAGLIEFLNDRGGKEDMYHLAEELLMEVDDLFPIVDAAVMLGFAHSTQGDVRPRSLRLVSGVNFPRTGEAK